jgi:hypothetical protein
MSYLLTSVHEIRLVDKYRGIAILVEICVQMQASRLFHDINWRLPLHSPENNQNPCFHKERY